MGSSVSEKTKTPQKPVKLKLRSINTAPVVASALSAKVKICKYAENPILEMAEMQFINKPDLKTAFVVEDHEPMFIKRQNSNIFQKSFEKTQSLEYKKTCILDEEDENIVSIGILRDEDL